jgi:hypothetical protein
MEAQMVACVVDSLRLYLHENARFMCERLVAEFPTPVRPQPGPACGRGGVQDGKVVQQDVAEGCFNSQVMLRWAGSSDSLLAQRTGQCAPACDLLLPFGPGLPCLPPVAECATAGSPPLAPCSHASLALAQAKPESMVSR